MQQEENNQLNGNIEINQIPNEIKEHFNCGAFLLTWIWGLFNKTYITLIYLILLFIPHFGIFLAFFAQLWFGIKGNEWAWKNKKWESVEQFHKNQKKWATAALILLILPIFSSFMLSTLKPAKFENGPHKTTMLEKINKKLIDTKIKRMKKEFDHYELSDKENKFYIDSEKWKTYSQDKKNMVFESALEIAAYEKINTNNEFEDNMKSINYSMFRMIAMPREFEITTIYSIQDNSILAKYNEADEIH